nr:hypothetical protein [Tanacetum cinerariifolium]
MVGGNGGNQFRQYAGQNARNLNGYNAVQNVGNQIGNGNLVAVRAERNAARHNGNQLRCSNCKGVGHFARDCTVRPRRRDVAYLQTQLLISQKEEAGIQLQAEEYDLMVVAVDLDEIEEVNANCILMANLQQASTSCTQTDNAPYTKLLEPIPEPLQVLQNDNDITSEVTSVEQAPHQDQPSFNQNYLQQPMPNPEDITYFTTAMNMALALMAKAFKLNYSTPINNNQRISSNPRNRQIAQPGMNMGQDRQMQMVGGNGRNQFRQYAGNPTGYNDVTENQVMQNAFQNPRVQNVRNQNGLICVQGNGNQNQIGNGNLVTSHADGNVPGQNGN